MFVTDPEGRPIAGASVSAVSLSINGPPRLTDEKGTAVCPTIGVQETKWVSVSAPGFQPRQLALPDEWPLRVTLIRPR